MKIKEKVFANNITKEERNKIGCKAVSGIPANEIADEWSINREFVYSQKRRIESIIEANCKYVNKDIIILDEKMKEKIIVACMLICASSTENTQQFLYSAFNVWVSIGKISRIINEAASKAQEWNSSIDLSGIKIGANDEIFQGKTPVIVGVEPSSTFTYMMEEVENRDSTTWGFHLLENQKNQGLELEMTVNDGGLGLRKGIKEAFPDVEEQLDTFHTEYDLSKAVKALERESIKAKNAEEKLENKLLSQKSSLTQEEVTNYENCVEKSRNSRMNFKRLKLLYVWLLEILCIGGYFYDEREDLLQYLISEMESIDTKNVYFTKSLKFIKGNVQEILYFVKKAELQMAAFASKEGIPEEVMKKMWKQLRYSPSSADYNYLEAEIGVILGDKYDETRIKWDLFIKNIVRASSLVECINSLIRPYMNIKKNVPNKFFALMQFYFNTRKYRRSGRAERVGKSPIELLTGMDFPEPLTILGY